MIAPFVLPPDACDVEASRDWARILDAQPLDCFKYAARCVLAAGGRYSYCELMEGFTAHDSTTGESFNVAAVHAVCTYLDAAGALRIVDPSFGTSHNVTLGYVVMPDCIWPPVEFLAAIGAVQRLPLWLHEDGRGDHIASMALAKGVALGMVGYA